MICYVVMTDNFMSGWGRSAGKTNKLVLECASRGEAQTVKRNAEDREDMRAIKIVTEKPVFGSDQYYVSWADKTTYPTWYREDEPFKEGRNKPKVQRGHGQKMMNQLAGIFTNPLIGFPGWEDTVGSHREEVIMDRMIQMLKAGNQLVEEATDREAMLYISSASFNAPLNTSWCRIYKYLFDKLYPQQGKEIDESMPKYQPLSGPIELSNLERRDLKSLKRWLWKRQNGK